MNITDTILRAHALASESVTLPPVVVPPERVEEVVSGLAEAVSATKKRDPEATSVVVCTASPLDREGHALVSAVEKRLTSLGFAPRLDVHQIAEGRSLPMAVSVTFPDLAAVAGKEIARREAWIAEALAIWKTKAGPTAAVKAKPTSQGDGLEFSAETLAVPSERDPFPTVPRLIVHEAGPAWSQRQAAEVVAEVDAALCPVLWTIEALDEAWKARGGSHATPGNGKWVGTDMYRGPSVILSYAKDQVTYLVREIHGLTPEQIVQKAAEEIGLPQKAQHNGNQGRGNGKQR